MIVYMNGLDGRINCPSYILSSFLDTFICTHYLQEKFEDTKGLIRKSNSKKNRQIIQWSTEKGQKHKQ